MFYFPTTETDEGVMFVSSHFFLVPAGGFNSLGPYPNPVG